MRTTNNSIINRPSRLCLSACLPHSHPAKARQTTPNHSSKSFVRNKAIPSGPRLAYLMV